MKNLIFVIAFLLPMVMSAQVELVGNASAKVKADGMRVATMKISGMTTDVKAIDYITSRLMKDYAVEKIGFKDGVCEYTAKKDVTDAMMVKYINEAYSAYKASTGATQSIKPQKVQSQKVDAKLNSKVQSSKVSKDVKLTPAAAQKSSKVKK